MFVFSISGTGQIELYTHLEVMKEILSVLEALGYRMCICYLLDASFTVDVSKFISGCFSSLSTMINLGLPHVNILSKADLRERWDFGGLFTRGGAAEGSRTGITSEPGSHIEEYLDVDVDSLIVELNESTPGAFGSLNESIGAILRDYNLISFIPVSVYSQESLENISLVVDTTLQYGEDEEPKLRVVEEE